ncbi:MAG: MltA domain-containing protein, partial [Deltaproteobacteria bacterium]|nr:MltA domain-containing protein [Deltaproteobacteria bacterium]
MSLLEDDTSFLTHMAGFVKSMGSGGGGSMDPGGRMVKRFGRFFSALLVALVLLSGCTALRIREVRRPEDALVRLKASRFPRFLDDLDKASLKEAVQGSIRYFRSLPQDRLLVLGPDTYTVADAVSSLEAFLALLEEARTPEEVDRLVASRFQVYQSVGHGWGRRVLFTGYYEPVVEGCLVRDEGH